MEKYFFRENFGSLCFLFCYNFVLMSVTMIVTAEKIFFILWWKYFLVVESKWYTVGKTNLSKQKYKSYKNCNIYMQNYSIGSKIL